MDRGVLRKTESSSRFEPINIKIVSEQRTVHLTFYQRECEEFSCLTFTSMTL
ncbi:rCG24309 [Rattus norvegicus]|uniref:RCG24309 n=1 Tax=Rattus norvegicus TaxID=10116 RepID=A6KB12_RAT|nr:rCG24309 [Rattus norvegicus]